jgi:hypothetical protein
MIATEVFEFMAILDERGEIQTSVGSGDIATTMEGTWAMTKFRDVDGVKWKVTLEQVDG